MQRFNVLDNASKKIYDMVKAKQDWANMCNPILKTYPYSNITDLNFQMFCNANLRKLLKFF